MVSEVRLLRHSFPFRSMALEFNLPPLDCVFWIKLFSETQFSYLQGECNNINFAEPLWEPKETEQVCEMGAAYTMG